jgi:hypothetical protein
MNNPDRISESSETIFLGVKYSDILMRIRDLDGKNSGIWMEKIRIRDGKTSDRGSEINIPDPQHWYPDQN